MQKATKNTMNQLASFWAAGSKTLVEVVLAAYNKAMASAFLE
jgi:hypothetical protein